MDDVQQAAILLLGMGEAQAAKVLKHMDHRQVEKIVAAMNSINNVTDGKVEQAISKMFTDSAHQTSIGASSKSYIKNTLISALGEEKAENLLGNTMIDESCHGLEVLRWQNVKTIVEMISEEHPQIIAIILTYLDSDQAAEALSMFPDKIRINLLKRIANIGSIAPIGLEKLNRELEAQSAQVNNFKELSLGGAKTVADIVNYLGTDEEESVLTGLNQEDDKLSEKVKDLMFPFEKLVEIDKRGLQKFLREVPPEKLVLALKAVEDEIKDALLSNMSERAAEMIKEELEIMGPVQLSKVEQAQKEIVAIAQKMGKAGEIMLGNTGETMV